MNARLLAETEFVLPSKVVLLVPTTAVLVRPYVETGNANKEKLALPVLPTAEVVQLAETANVIGLKTASFVPKIAMTLLVLNLAGTVCAPVRKVALPAPPTAVFVQYAGTASVLSVKHVLLALPIAVLVTQLAETEFVPLPKVVKHVLRIAVNVTLFAETEFVLPTKTVLTVSKIAVFAPLAGTVCVTATKTA